MLTAVTNQRAEEKMPQVREVVTRLLAIIGFPAARVDYTQAAGSLSINIVAEDGRELIGARGLHLAALSHLIRSILRRQLDQSIVIKVDVNGYLAAHEQILKRRAENAAGEAVRTGRAVVLSPMNPAERRLIHTTLVNKAGVHTASLGEEPNRRVIIRPVII